MSDLANKLSSFYSYLFTASQHGFAIVTGEGLSRTAIQGAALEGILPSKVAKELLELRMQDKIARRADKNETIQGKLRSKVNSLGLGGILETHNDPSDGSVTITLPGRAPLKLTKAKIAGCLEFLSIVDDAREVRDEQDQAPDLKVVGE